MSEDERADLNTLQAQIDAEAGKVPQPTACVDRDVSGSCDEEDIEPFQQQCKRPRLVHSFDDSEGGSFHESDSASE